MRWTGLSEKNSELPRNNYRSEVRVAHSDLV
jgi:hypothetical protein